MKQMTKRQLENQIYNDVIPLFGVLLSPRTCEVVRYELSRRLQLFTRNKLDEILSYIRHCDLKENPEQNIFTEEDISLLNSMRNNLLYYVKYHKGDKGDNAADWFDNHLKDLRDLSENIREILKYDKQIIYNYLVSGNINDNQVK